MLDPVNHICDEESYTLRKRYCVSCGKEIPPFYVGDDPGRCNECAIVSYADTETSEVKHPQHYTFGQFEVIDVLEDWFPHDPLLWQVGKYIARAIHKGHELQDLEKAAWYLARRIAQKKAEHEANRP